MIFCDETRIQIQNSKETFFKVGWNKIWRHLWLHCHYQGTATLHFQSSSTARLSAWITLPTFVCSFTHSSQMHWKGSASFIRVLSPKKAMQTTEWIDQSKSFIQQSVICLPVFCPPRQSWVSSVGTGIFLGLYKEAWYMPPCANGFDRVKDDAWVYRANLHSANSFDRVSDGAQVSTFTMRMALTGSMMVPKSIARTFTVQTALTGSMTMPFSSSSLL